MTTFRILHCSDLHIARVPESLNFIDAPSSRARFRSAVNRLRGGDEKFRYRYPTTHDPAALCDVARHAFNDVELDLILITGDIATTGDPLDVAPAAAFVTAPATGAWMANTVPTLEAARTPIALLPGNHDRYANSLFPFGTASTRFDDYFKQFWSCGQSAMLLGVLEKENEYLAIVGADFSLRAGWEEPLAAAGEGEAYSQVLETLSHQTRALRQRFAERSLSVAIVWAIHFAPEFKGINPKLRLRDETSFLRVAAENGVSFVTCGHTHEPRAYNATTAPVGIFCAGTATAYKARHGNVIHTLEVDVAVGAIKTLQIINHSVGVV